MLVLNKVNSLMILTIIKKANRIENIKIKIKKTYTVGM